MEIIQIGIIIRTIVAMLIKLIMVEVLIRIITETMTTSVSEEEDKAEVRPMDNNINHSSNVLINNIINLPVDTILHKDHVLHSKLVL